MLKKISLMAVLAAVAMVPSSGAKAYPLNPYLGFALGSSTNTMKTVDSFGNATKASLKGDFAYTFAGGFQLDLIPLITPRVEFEYANLSSSNNGVEGNVAGYGVNAYVSLPLMPIIKPYIGVGVMRMAQEFGAFKSEAGNVPQYMVGLDLDIPMVPIAGGIEWRYMNMTGSVDQPLIDTLKSSVSTVLAKIRVQF